MNQKSKPTLFVKSKGKTVRGKQLNELYGVYRDFLDRLATDEQFRQSFENACRRRNRRRIIRLFGADHFDSFFSTLRFRRIRLRPPGSRFFFWYECCEICCWSHRSNHTPPVRVCFEVCYRVR